ncbi:ABC transporter ATP-binding protein/permease [Microbacterium suaedae]|uniref:ABC transporter ATP-binding protein/permease n=1 Tax=Microbacterium suaedae TaxID=2067813 RepID=UPI000DA11272|nr:ABC transporter ATP-binding protein/permease [Microbacterium suaedae]
MPRLSLRRIAKHYGEAPRVDALRGLDLDVPQGTYLAIEGESGGGKSTLLNILGLLDAPSSGEYHLDEVDVSLLSDGDAAARRSDYIGFIFQSFHLLDRRPVVDNVELPMHYRGVPTEERRGRALRALDAVGLSEFAWTTPRTLSGGQRQRVAIARALASETPIVLADEPTGNLDSENSAAVLRSFERLRDVGTTLVVVTHSEQVAAHAERRIRVVDGRVVEDASHPADGSPQTGSRPPFSLALSGDPSEGSPRNDTRSAPQMAPAGEPRGEGVAGSRTVSTARDVPPGRASHVRFLAGLRDAWANAVSRPGRALGLVATVALSLALVVTTLGLAASAQTQVSSEFDVVTSRDVSARVDGDGVSPAIPRSTGVTLAALGELNGVAAAAILADVGSRGVRVGPPRGAVSTGTLLGTGEVEEALRLDVAWAGDTTRELTADTAIVGAYLADNLGLTAVDLEPTIDVDGRTVTVVGIIDDSPRAPDLMGKLVLGSDADRIPTSTVTAYVVTDTGAAHQVAGEMPHVMDPHHPDALQIDQPVELNSVRAGVEESIAMSMTILTIVALIAATASVVIASVTSVGERSEEIGLRRAIGARRSHISGMLTAESIAVGLIGGLGGVALGMGAILALTIARRWTPVFDPVLGLVAVGGGIFIACIGALAGVIRASRIQPSDALRS